MKRMLINATQKEELRVALVDGQRLYDLDIETLSAKQKKSNIYKGKITRVEPSLEAAFVDYGADRHGFLPIKEISKEYFSGSTATVNKGKPDYKKLIPEGQEVMVQVDKEERGNKGAALTTYIGLAGRYSVAMPNNPRGGGVSRRVQGSERRELLSTIDKVEIPDNVGVIVRTAGVGRNHEELQWDLNYQLQVWQAISAAYESANVGDLLYLESDIIVRALRDYFRDDIMEIIIDDESVYQRAYGFVSLVMPDKTNCLKLYQNELPLFTRYQVEAQIDSAYGRSVRLPSGGELVIDYTEAMVSIDINSARSTKGGDVEETALHTNLEAAEEVSRQLRLRDIGGLIVVDFIDMYEAKHRRQVEEKMKESIRIDRARVQVARISKFGLLEMSRQRLRPSIDEASHSVCPRCKGQGSIRSTQSVALSVLRLIEEDANKHNTVKIIAQLPIRVATFLLNEKRQAIANIEKVNNVDIIIVANNSLETPNFDLQRVRDDDGSVNNIVSYKMVKDFNAEDDGDEDTQLNNQHAGQEAIVSDIARSVRPTQKSKIGFFQMVKQVLGIGADPADSTVNESAKKQTNPKEPNATQKQSSTSDSDKKNGHSSRGHPSKDKQINTKNASTSSSRQSRKKVFDDNDNQQSSQNKPNHNKNDTAQQHQKKSDSNHTENVQDKTISGNHNKGKNTKREKKPTLPFVNEFAVDKSKMHQGRRVSEDAVRGAGKAGFISGDANQEKQHKEDKKTGEDIRTKQVASQSISEKAEKINNKAKEQPKKGKNSSSSALMSSADDSERVYVPRAVVEAVPALWMKDDTTALVTESSPEKTDERVTERVAVTTASTSTNQAKKSDINHNPIAALSAFGQSIWYDNISRDMIESGELARLINEDDLRGITSNPAIFEKALSSNHSGYLAYLASVKGQVTQPKEAFFALAIRDITEACVAMRETFDKTKGTDGMVSLEVSPDLAYDTEKTIEEALILNQKLGQPNAMIKVPGTEQGLIAIEQLTYLGLNINVTLLFSVSRYIGVFEAYMRGLQKRAEMGLSVDNIRSVASFFISRLDAQADKVLVNTNPEMKGKVAIANAKVAYDAYLTLLESEQWQRLKLVGAKPQRLLWASTSPKDPDYDDVLYVEQLIGKDTVNTLPPATYKAFKDHGKISETITHQVIEAKALIQLLPQYGVDLDLITQQLEMNGVKAFEQSFETLLSVLGEKMKG
ncbi:MAG: transaldolase [Ostreibacterium sp.]